MVVLLPVGCKQGVRVVADRSDHRCCIPGSSSNRPRGCCPSSIDVRVVQGYPHWAYSWSPFGGTGISLERVREATTYRCRLPLAFVRFHSKLRFVVDGEAHTKTCPLCRGARKGVGATKTSRTLLD